MQREVIGLIADAVAASGVRRVYGFGLAGERALPAVLPPGGVAAVVWPGATRSLELRMGSMRHVYEVEVWLMVPLGDLGVTAGELVPLPDEVMRELAHRVASASRTYAALRIEGASAPHTVAYAGVDYLVVTVTCEVTESITTTPGVGP